LRSGFFATGGDVSQRRGPSPKKQHNALALNLLFQAVSSVGILEQAVCYTSNLIQFG
jgi:hypothetical protein